MSGRPARRVPFGPVLDQAGHASARVIAKKLEVSSKTIQRWKKTGIPIWEAERAAIRLGTHPALLWPDVFAGD